MPLSPLAGKPAPDAILIDPEALVREYYNCHPDPTDALQLVSFGTSGHRGSAAHRTFNEDHILAIAQAICDYRAGAGIAGPLYMGMDTHALSAPAQRTALEVLAANAVDVFLSTADADDHRAYTPTPAVSHAILTYNRGRTTGFADGIVITPSHNPPEDGGFKYNPPNGGPADTDVTQWVQDRANELLRGGNRLVRRMPYDRAALAGTTHRFDFIAAYVQDLGSVIDMEAIRRADLKLGADAMGGASVAYWQPIAEHFGLDVAVVNPTVDPTFRFMTVDHDGKIRMDCSSPYAMAGLIGLKRRYAVAFGNDTDADRHGIVTPSAGLINPNHYLSVAVRYLFSTRESWRADAAVGKTVVTSAMVDRVAASLLRRVAEVPVGFKWFVGGLIDGSYGFGGEESAGASFLRRNGAVWTTDKDGIIMDLLAAEMTAVTRKDPGEHYRELCAKLGEPLYVRVDQPATPDQKARLKRLAPNDVKAATLAGEPILHRLTRAPENDAEIGGLKVVTKNGWFAARPSGTEDVYKIYAESFRDQDHLDRILAEAREIVSLVFA